MGGRFHGDHIFLRIVFGDVLRCPPARAVVVRTELQLIHFGMVLQKGFQCGGRFGRAVCRCVLGTQIPPSDSLYLSARPPSSVMWASASGAASYTAARRLHLRQGCKGMPFVASPACSLLNAFGPSQVERRRGIARDAIRSRPTNTAVIRQAFVPRDPSGLCSSRITSRLTPRLCRYNSTLYSSRAAGGRTNGLRSSGVLSGTGRKRGASAPADTGPHRVCGGERPPHGRDEVSPARFSANV